MFNDSDIQQIKGKGLTVEKVEEQLSRLANGFPFLKLHSAATTDKGISSYSKDEQESLLAAWDEYVSSTQEHHKVVKFVPASGAASRMFKNVFAFADADYDVPTTDFEKAFFGHIHNAAFFSSLDEACQRLYQGLGIDSLMEKGRYKDIAKALLSPEGLNYGALPKGLLKFHKYEGGDIRTPMEEHLVEAALYAAGNKQANIHFTVSPEHKPLFEKLAKEKVPAYEKQFGLKYNISFSEQKPSTDTIASTPDGKPFRQADGSLLFRPGGHGALIENLNDIDADVVFIKNIDNVVPDRLKPDTVRYKKLLAGVLVSLQKQAFDYLRKLDSGCYTMKELLDMLQFVQKKLCCKNPDTKTLEDTELAIYLRSKLHRPMRVCGMVRNVGEPGGGPFLAYNADGTISPQILESSQIDMNDPEKKAMFENGTHFNPVDIVCGLRDHKGNKYHLPDFVDHNTGFISHKSKNGRDLLALELPGLWNGAMSDWNTVFIEVPLSTFNPVKTVNDLYREQHQ